MSKPESLIPPPPGYTQNFKNPDFIGYRIWVVNAVFIPVTLIALGIRLYTRCFLTRNPGWDDGWLVLAMITSIALSALSIYGTQLGLGSHIWDLPVSMVIPGLLKINAICAIVYNWPVFFLKLSMAVLFLRISPNKSYRWCCYLVIAIIVASSIARQVALFLQCVPLARAWDPSITSGFCLNRPAISLAGGVINVVLDFALLFLPLPTIWRMPLLPRRQKIALTCVFAVGLFVCAVSIVRLVETIPLLGNMDVSWTSVNTYIWCVIEIDAGIICASMATMRPFFRRFFPGFLGTQKHGYGREEARHANSRFHGTGTQATAYGMSTNRSSDDKSDQDTSAIHMQQQFDVEVQRLSKQEVEDGNY